MAPGAPRREGPGSSQRVLSPYTAWVIGYDVPWVYGLWRLNRS